MHTSPESMESPIQDKPKEEHTEKHFNKIEKNERQKILKQ